MMSNSSTSDFLPLDPVEVFGHFTEISEIPTQGFNVLLRAKRHGQWWVLKGLKTEYRQKFLYQELLHKEYNLLSRLHHGDVVAVHGMEQVEGYGECIVMEWVDGESLRQWLKRPHSKAEKRKVFGELLSAVGYVHHEQIVHRDLKPSNIMITRNGQHVKLIDFGLADADNYAIFKQPTGTEGYIAPEQLEGSALDIRNDIYSLGVVLDKMRLGWVAHRVAVKCQKDIQQRYADVETMRAALVSGRRRVRIACWVAALLLLFMGAFYAYQKWNEPRQTYEIVADFKVGYLRYQSWGGGLVSVKSTSDADSCVEIPGKVSYLGISYQVNEVAFRAFENHRHLRRVVFPDAEWHLMGDAFVECPNLKSLYFRTLLPPHVGNDLWTVDILNAFDPRHFDQVTLYVPQGSASVYRKSEWGKFKRIREYAEDSSGEKTERRQEEKK